MQNQKKQNKKGRNLEKVPVTMITGYLGSGKTTLMNEVLDDWDEKYGDRMNQIVFIGRGYDKEKIINKLKGCHIS